MSEKKTPKKKTKPTAPATSPGPMDVGLLEQLVQLMSANDLNTVDLRDGQKRVVLKRGAVVASGPSVSYAGPSYAPPPAPLAIAPPSGQTPPPPANEDVGLVPIKSPMVGTFYAKANPESKPFVSVGSTVNEETDVCVIEAMKVFNNIKAETTGTIAKVLVNDGQTVEFGTILFFGEAVNILFQSRAVPSPVLRFRQCEDRAGDSPALKRRHGATDMSDKRHLNLHTEDDALAEIARLRKGYTQNGNWTLPMMAPPFRDGFRELAEAPGVAHAHARRGGEEGGVRRRHPGERPPAERVHAPARNAAPAGLHRRGHRPHGIGPTADESLRAPARRNGAFRPCVHRRISQAATHATSATISVFWCRPHKMRDRPLPRNPAKTRATEDTKNTEIYTEKEE